MPSSTLAGRLRGIYRRDAGGDARRRRSCATFPSCRRCPIRSRRISGPPASSVTSCSFRGRASSSPGRIVGLVLDCGAARAQQERLANLGFAAHRHRHRRWQPTQLSFRPTWYPQSHFWTTSPAFFFIRARHHDRGASASRMPGSCGPAARRNGVRSSNWAGRRSSSTGFTSRWSTA